MTIRFPLLKSLYKAARRLAGKTPAGEYQVRMVPVDKILMGAEGETLAGIEYVRLTGDWFRTSTRCLESPHVKLLRAFKARGMACIEDRSFEDTEYYNNALTVIQYLSGYYPYVRSPEEIRVAARRLRQLGEKEGSIFVIGSPDIDAMFSANLPPIDEVRKYYSIPFDTYGIVLFHSVTTDSGETTRSVQAMVAALLHDEGNYVVIYPNNDEGCDLVFSAYERLAGNQRFRVFPSVRFESFLTLIKHAEFIIGNSSAGVREAPVYGVRSINISTRQFNRFKHESITDVSGDENAITTAIRLARAADRLSPSYHFGCGESARLFMEALRGEAVWALPAQKQFVDQR